MRAALRTTALASILAISLAACSGATSGGSAPSGVSDAAPLPAKADNFQLVDQNRDAHDLYYSTTAPAIVLLTHAPDDPVSQASGAALSELRKTYKDSGAVFYMLASAEGFTREAAAQAAEAGGFADIPVLVDETQLVGEQLGVTRGAEAFVIDPKSWKVVYRGPIDSRFGEHPTKDASQAYLKTTLDSMIAGGMVEPASLASGGAEIAFPGRDNAAVHAQISYAADIAPMLVEKCASCHAEGGIAPFAMNSYELVKGFAPMIREAVRTNRMPPFFADRHTGEWLHDNSLSVAEQRTLIHWIEAGAPRGDGEDLLTQAVQPAPEWPLGKPDLILTLPPFQVPASGVVEYQYPAVANPLKETKWLRASTIIPGDRSSVHHVLSGYMTEMPKNGAPALQTKWQGSMGSYTPGQEAQILPHNTTVELPPGGAIGFQLHYTPMGKDLTDVTRVGLYFHDKPPEFIKRSAVIADATIKLQPHQGNQREIAYMTFPADALLYTAYPHAHYRAVQANLTAEYPDGTKELLLDLPRYDFNWQRDYDFKEPKLIPKGTRMVARFTYDNSALNKANPDPSKLVTWGDQTFEEMFYLRLNYRWLDETRTNPKNHDGELMQSLLTGMVDNNLDGKVDPLEAMNMAAALSALANSVGGAPPEQPKGTAGGSN